MGYSHTQTSPIHWVVAGVALLLAMAAIASAGIPAVAITLGVSALIVAVLAFCFASLTVEGRDDELFVRYGPLPFFRTRIRLVEVDWFERERTTWLDGWGVHYVPGRGWTYNLWGFDCVRFEIAGRTVRVGTDDPDGLIAYLERQWGRQSS